MENFNFLWSEFEHVAKPLRDYHLSKNVRKYYRCAKRFADCYWVFFNNLIARHRDHRKMRISITGRPIVNRDFQYTYHHLKRDHIAGKKYCVHTKSCHVCYNICQLFIADHVPKNILKPVDVLVQPTPLLDFVKIMNGTHICA